MKILAEFNGKKCFIVDTFTRSDSLYCVVIIDDKIDYVWSNQLKIIDNELITK